MTVTLQEWKDTHREQRGRGLKVAKELQRIAKHRRYPDNPYPCLDSWKDTKANDLTKSIIGFIKLLGYQAERISSTGRVVNTQREVVTSSGFKHRIGSVQYIKSTSTNGTADISATVKGRSVKIEVKIGRDKQSSDQSDYQRDVESAGGIYYIAKDFQSFYDWFAGLIATI